jgi:hypothetical protein
VESPDGQERRRWQGQVRGEAGNKVEVNNRETFLQKVSLTPQNPLPLPPMTAFPFSCCKDFSANTQKVSAWGLKSWIRANLQKYAAPVFPGC